MANAVFDAQTAQLVGIWEDFLRLQPRLKTRLPAELARLKERLGEWQPEGGARRVASYDLYYRVGVVLSRARAPLTMGELAEALAVPLSTATRMIDWLVESGDAERLPDPEDRRIVRVALTPAGQARYQTIQTFIREQAEQVLRCFTDEEREQLIGLLRKLVRALKETAG